MSVRVRPAGPADAACWDAYVTRAPGSHFAQRWAWREVMRASYGCAPEYTLAETNGGICGVLPLWRTRSTLFSAPGGLLADDEGTAAALLAPAAEPARAGRVRWLELRDQRRAWPGLETNPEHCTLELALAPTEEAQWRALDAKVRNQVRNAERSGVTIREDDGVEGFHRVMLEAMRDLGTPLQDVAFFRRARTALGDRARVLLAEHAGTVIGTMFAVRWGDTLADPWAASLRRTFRMNPNMLLYWEAMRRAIADGCRRFDFGRSQWDSGTFRFKRQWGAEPVPLFYQYALAPGVPMPTLAAQKHGYDLIVRAWRKLPLPVARVLGGHARRRFPEVL